MKHLRSAWPVLILGLALITSACQSPNLHGLAVDTKRLTQRAVATKLKVAQKDRAMGSFLGLAIGDAIGTTLEFTKRDTYRHLTDMIGGGPFKLKPGQFTDDTSMALCLAESLIEHKEFDPKDLMVRFKKWYRGGYNSVTGTCFDIGIATRTAIEKFERTGRPYAGDSNPSKAGNGSMMRLSPVPIRYHANLAKAVSVAKLQSKTTHSSLESVEGSALLAHMIVLAIEGKGKAEVLSPKGFQSSSPKIQELASSNSSWKKKARSEIHSSGYVVHTLEAAMWCVFTTSSFEEAVLKAVNLGDDADTVGAVTGQIAGALYGKCGIPKKWLDRLFWKQKIENYAAQLFSKV